MFEVTSFMPELRGHIRLFQRVICKLQTVKMPILMANSDKLHPPMMSTFVCRSSWQEATHEWMRMSSLMPWASMISIFLIKDEWLHTHTHKSGQWRQRFRACCTVSHVKAWDCKSQNDLSFCWAAAVLNLCNTSWKFYRLHFTFSM